MLLLLLLLWALRGAPTISSSIIYWRGTGAPVMHVPGHACWLLGSIHYKSCGRSMRSMRAWMLHHLSFMATFPFLPHLPPG